MNVVANPVVGPAINPVTSPGEPALAGRPRAERSAAAAGATATSPAAWPLRAALLAGVAFAVLLAAGVGDPAPRLAADAELAQVMRGISLIKGAFAAVAVILVFWRVGQPGQARRLAAMLPGCWAMAGAAGLVWQLSHFGLASLAFHAGWLSIALAAWREGRAAPAHPV